MALCPSFLFGFYSLSVYSLFHRYIRAFTARGKSAKIGIAGVMAQVTIGVKWDVDIVTIPGVSFV